MTTIYEALRDSHDLQRNLCNRLTRAPASDPGRRESLMKALKTELAAHAAAEERFLYVPLLMDDQGLDVSRHALSEHHDIDEAVERLESLAIDGSAWLDQAKRLSRLVRHHLDEEEGRFFQVSGRILDDRQKQTLAGDYRRDYARMHEVLAD